MCVGGDMWPGPPQCGPCGFPLPGVPPCSGMGVAEQFAGLGLSFGPLFEAAAASIGHVGVVGAQGLAQGLVVGDGGAAAAAAFAALGPGLGVGGVVGGKQRKHTRPTFSGHQIFALEKTFEQVCPVAI